MNIKTLGSFACAIIFSGTLSITPGLVSDSFAARKCQSQDRAFKKTLREERKAESEYNKADRTLASLIRRHESTVEKCADKAVRCVNKVDRLNDTYTAQLDRAEADRQRYIADSVQLGIQRVACELEVMTGGSCNPNRFYTAIAKMGQRITKAEQRIATLRNLLNQKLQTQQDICRREQLTCDTTVARALGRVQVQTPKTATKQTVLAEKSVIREAAEQTLLQCQAANP